MKISHKSKSVKSAYKVFSLFTCFFLLLSQASPSIVYAISETEEASEVNDIEQSKENDVIDRTATGETDQESENNSEEKNTDAQSNSKLDETNEVETEEVEAMESPEKEESEEGDVSKSENQNTDKDFEKSKLGYYKSENLQLEKEYTLNELNGLKVVFTKLPKGENKIMVNSAQADTLKSGKQVGTAYEIKSNMENGSFVYDLYLPAKESSDTLKVVYTEDGVNYESIESKKEGNFLVARELNHFTVFVVVDPNPEGDGNPCLVSGINGICYDTIQEAIDAAGLTPETDTIYVADGTYNEHLNVNTDVVLEAINPGSAIINGGGSGRCININSSNVTITGLGVTNCAYGIASYGGPSTFDNVSITNTRIYHNSVNGVLFVYDTLNSWSIVDVAIDDTFGPGSVGLGIANNATLNDLNLENVSVTNSSGHGIYINGSTLNNTYLNNLSVSNAGWEALHVTNGSVLNEFMADNSTFTDAGYGIYLNGTTSITKLSVTNSDISSNTSFGLFNGTGTEVMAKNNWWGDDSGPSDSWSGDGSYPDTNNGGSGNAAYGAVNYCPWLNSSGGVEGPCLYWIQGRKYIDSNLNTYMDSSEYPGVQNWEIVLYDSSWQQINSMLTGDDSAVEGNVDDDQYRFENLVNGTYYVCESMNAPYAQSGPAIDDHPRNTSGIIVHTNAIGVRNTSQNHENEGHICWEVNVNDDNVGYTKFGNYPLETPANTGWNLRSQSSDPYERPADLTCGALTNGDIDEFGDARISHQVDYTGTTNISIYDVEIVRRVTRPSGQVGYYTGYNTVNPNEYYTDFVTFGNPQGEQGVWTVETASYLDINNNGVWNNGEPRSDWSDSCTIELDSVAPQSTTWTTPTAPVFFTRLGDRTGSRVNMTFVENPDPSDVAYYEYQYTRYLLDNTGYGSRVIRMNGVTCNSGICVWSPTMSDGVKNIHRFRAVDAAGNTSAWSNWTNLDINDFESIAAEDFDYNDYLNLTGVFDPANGYIHGNGGFAIREQNLPTSTLVSPTNPTLTNNPEVTVEFEFEDLDTEVKQVELMYEYEGSGSYTTLAVYDPGVHSEPATGTLNVTLADGDGTYCFHTIAEDVADDLILDNGEGNREDPKGCELEITLDTTPPEEPLFWVEENDNEIVVFWDHVSDGVSYYIYRDGEEIYNGNDTQYVDNRTGTHTYVVTAEDAAGNENDMTAIEEETGTTFDVVIDDDSYRNDYESNGSVSYTGSWNTYDVHDYEDILDDAVGGDLYGTNHSSGQTFTWTDNGQGAFYGVYEVWASYLCNDPRPTASYSIYSGGELVAGPIEIYQDRMGDQITECGQQGATNTEVWVMLAGEVPLYEGEPVEVVLTAPNDQYNIVADAVGFNFQYDFSYIQGRKLMDVNADGRRQLNNPDYYMNDWKITLFDTDWTLLESQDSGVTGNVGQYRFEDLMPGTYYVCEENRDGFVQTALLRGSGQGTDGETIEANESDYAPLCHVVTVEAGENTEWVQFGNFETAMVWGNKWEDINLNRSMDSDEQMLSGWTIYADMTINGQLDTDAIVTTTQADGTYVLEGLMLGTYEICEVMQNGWVQSYPTDDFNTNMCYEYEVTMPGQVQIFPLNFGNYEDLYPLLELDPASVTYVEQGNTLVFTVIPSGGNQPEGGYTGSDITWGGDCMGTGLTKQITNASGSYTCTATIEDLDGDTYTLTINGSTYTNPPQNPENPGNDNPVSPVVGGGDVLGTDSEDEETDQEDEETEEEEGEVLGEETCEETSLVSGYIYYDDNSNDEYDYGEQGIDEVQVVVYVLKDGEEKEVVKVTPDEAGYWQADVCPGEYKVKLIDLPEGSKVRGDEVLSISVPEDEGRADVNFAVEKEKGSGFNWAWCLVPLALVLLLLVLVVLTRKKDSEGSVRSF